VSWQAVIGRALRLSSSSSCLSVARPTVFQPACNTLFLGHRMGTGGEFQRLPIWASPVGQTILDGQLAPLEWVCNHQGDWIRSPVLGFRTFLSLFLHLSAIVLVLFCLSCAKTEARCIGRKEGGEIGFTTTELWVDLHQKQEVVHRKIKA
jgi:hypothetical protein